MLPEQTYHVDQAKLDDINKEVMWYEVGLINEVVIKLISPSGINLDSF